MSTRLCTRVKRKWDITTSISHGARKKTKKKGDRTFTSKESAEKYAKETRKLKAFSIVSAKKSKRFKIIVE